MAPRTPEVSVVLATYNRAHLVGGALESLADQDASGTLHWEIVVVDNNSADATRAVIEDFAQRVPIPVRYVFERAQGLSHARNAGVAAAGGSVIAFTDDDVRPDRTWLRALVHGLAAHTADGIGGRVRPRWAAPPPPWLAENHHLWPYLAMLEHQEFARLEVGQRRLINGANMAFRRVVFDTIGGFDTTLGRMGEKLYSREEHDFIERALCARFNIVYDPALVVWHHVGADRMRKGYFRAWCFDNGEQEAFILGPVRGRSIVGIPLYSLRAMLVDMRDWLLALFGRDPRTFVRETDVWRDIGFVWGRLKMRRRGAVC